MSDPAAEDPFRGLTRKQGETTPQQRQRTPTPPASGETIRDYYERKHREAIRCWREHGPYCRKGCGDSGD